MVTDHISRADTFASLGTGFQRAFAFLRRSDLSALPVGTHELDGQRIYALVQEYQTKRADEGKWEAHRKYIDVQFIVSGRERFGFAQVNRMPAGAYDEAKDMERPTGEGAFTELRAGEFIILWPGEPHMPGMALVEPAAVKKVVVKIALGQ
jgi:YhcH/YjgK/YiaL family protein